MTSVIWKVQKVDAGVASVRIRTLAPALLLRKLGFRLVVTSKLPDQKEVSLADVVVVNKSFSAADIELCRRAKNLGKKLIVDLCDDLSDERRSAERHAFCDQAKLAHTIVTTGDELKSRIQTWLPHDAQFEVIPDVAEDASLLRSLVAEFPPASGSKSTRLFKPSVAASFSRRLLGIERRFIPARKKIVWFGNAGNAGSGAGLESLRLVANHLESVNNVIPIQLVVVTRGYKEFASTTKQFAFPCIYREWTLLGAPEIIEECDVCILPNPSTNFAKAKSSNRCLLALNCGVPVVATNIPSIQSLADCIVIEDWQSGILNYLSNSDLRLRDVSLGQSLIKKMYGPEVIAESWSKLLSQH